MTMLNQTIELLSFVAFAALAWYFLYRAVPTVGRRASLALLHNRRDYLYRMKRNDPAWDDSLIYQDMLFGLTLFIHLVRDAPRRVSVPVVAELLWGKSSRKGSQVNWRTSRYDYELSTRFARKESERELLHLYQVFRSKDVVLTLFIVTAHPFFLCFALAVCLLSPVIAPILYFYFYWQKPPSGDIKAVGMTLESIRTYQERDPLTAFSG